MKRQHLIDLRKKHGIGQVELAKKLNVSQSAISQLENGTTEDISGKLLTGYINLFNVPADWVDTGTVKPKSAMFKAVTSVKESIGNYSVSKKEVKEVPIISSVQAGNWAENTDPYYIGDNNGTVLTTATISENAYALVISGDSMHPTLTEGSIIIVEPNRQPENKQIVVVRQNGDSEATVKRLVIEGSRKYLKPDNDRYPIMEMLEDAYICGVAIKEEKDLL